jgi:hypothetical protein
MCWDCGCKMYDDDMGSPNTITTKRLEEMASSSGKSLEEFLDELHEAIHQGKLPDGLTAERMEAAANDMGHSVENALKELHDSVHVHGHKHQGE